MKEIVEYCVEYRRDNEKKYFPSFSGFKDKDLAFRVAQTATKTLHSRVVEQRRKVIKTFSLTRAFTGPEKTPASDA